MAGLTRKLIDPKVVLLPQLPTGLEGLKIAHITDLHIRRPRARHRQIAASFELMQIDLVLLTGDYMDRAGDEEPCLAAMTRVCERLEPRLGIFGVFGNHDTLRLRPMLEQLPVHWLKDSCYRIPGQPIEVVGFDTTRTRVPDAVATLQSIAAQNCHAENSPATTLTTDNCARPLRLLLSHLPSFLPTAADIGVDLMFSGHTHGGQCRLPGRRAIYNSIDLPLRLSAGVLRHQNTLCMVSRGLGEAWLPFRVFCPPHMPVYTLRRGPMPGHHCHDIINVMPW